MRRVSLNAAAIVAAGLLAIGTALATGNNPTGVTHSRPGPQPNNELIAFQRSSSAPGSRAQIWIMDGDGKEPREISHTPGGASDTLPSVSLSLGVVVWQRVLHGSSQIMTGDVFGDPVRQLTSFPSGASHPSLSRTAALIVFSVGSGTNCDLWIVGYDGHGLRRLTDHGGTPACDTEPVWSPDSRRIAFRRTTSGGRHSRELVVAVTGGAPRPLLLPPDVPAFNWAPGSDFLVVSGGATPALEAIGPDGAIRRTLVTSKALLGRPTWAPDSVRAAFALRQSDGSTDLFSVDGSGGTLTGLTHTPGVSESNPSWAYPSNQGSEPGPGVHAHSLPSAPHRRRR